MTGEIILKLIEIQNQFRILHWQTFGDAKHRAYGDVYSGFDSLIDDFAEAMMGKYGRPEFGSDFSVNLTDISAISLQSFIDESVDFLVSMTDKLDSRYDTDLLNIRDEMMGLLNKLKYLLTLKS